jgi:hypothetical protein
MSAHRFKVGDQVRVSRAFPDRSGSNLYEVLRLMPESPNGERHYRLRGPDKIERAVSESDLLAGSDRSS